MKRIKVHKVNNYNPNKTTKLNIRNCLEQCLLSIDRFLVYLAEHKPHLLDSFVKNLKFQYKSKISVNFINFDADKLSKATKELKVLSKFPELIDLCINLFLTLLKVPTDFTGEVQELDILDLNISKARLVPVYYLSKLLTEMIKKDEAIQLLKDYFEYAVVAYRNIKQYQDLTAIYEDCNKQENTILINAMINDGIYAGKGFVCLAHEALKEFNDPELAYIICCHGDSAIIRKYNENFVMTRRYTLMDGSYCDTTAHDTRIVTKIEHPSEEFYQTLDSKLEQ